MLLSSTRFLGSRKFPVSQLGSFSPRLLPKCISAFQPSLRTANNFHTGNRLPQSASKIQKAIYLLHAITLSTVVYIISTNIKVVPETGHKQLDCTWENWNKRVGIAKLNLVCKALAKLKKAGVNLYIGPDDERLKRIGRIAQRIFIGNNLNQDSWFIAMLDNTNLVPFSIVNRNAVFLNSKILCTSDDELAFHLSYEIANCIIKPEREVISMMLLAMGTVPSILLNRTLRKSIALSALGIFCGFFLNSCHRQAIEIDRLASKIMASAGYNSAAALQVAMKERNAVSIIGWTFLTTSWPYLEERKRIFYLEKNMPEALGLVPTQLEKEELGIKENADESSDGLAGDVENTTPVDELLDGLAGEKVDTAPANEAPKTQSPPDEPSSSESPL